MLKRALLVAGAMVILLAGMPFFESNEAYTRFVRLEARMKRLEAMMEALLDRLGIDPAEVTPPEPSPAQNPAIREALLRGHKIEAIKLYREQYGVGLKEAKDAIDAMQSQYRGY